MMCSPQNIRLLRIADYKRIREGDIPNDRNIIDSICQAFQRNIIDHRNMDPKVIKSYQDRTPISNQNSNGGMFSNNNAQQNTSNNNGGAGGGFFNNNNNNSSGQNNNNGNTSGGNFFTNNSSTNNNANNNNSSNSGFFKNNGSISALIYRH